MDRPPLSPTKAHSRSKSATILKSIISPSKSSSPKKVSEDASRSPSKSQSSSTESRALGEIGSQSPSKSPKKKTLKKQKSEVDFWTEPDTPLSPAECQLLSPQRSFAPSDKENKTPPRSRHEEPYTPIWAEFSTQPLKDFARLEQHCSNSSRESQQSRNSSNPYFPSKPYSLAPAPPITGQRSRPASRCTPIKTSLAQHDTPELGEENKSPVRGAREPELKGQALDEAFENVLAARNIPENRRSKMRSLDISIKRDFIKNDNKVGNLLERPTSEDGTRRSQSPIKAPTDEGRTPRGRRDDRNRVDGDMSSVEEAAGSPTKRKSRSRSRTFAFNRRDWSKKPRSQSRPRSLISLKNPSSLSVAMNTVDNSRDSEDSQRRLEPDAYVNTIRSSGSLEKIEVGRVQKLRRLLRHESISWVDDFVAEGGMDALVDMLRRIMKIEWREEHEDILLHETLLCLKGLCTTKRALGRLNELQEPFFPELLQMLFDEERRGPAEYGTRSIIIHLFFEHLSAASSTELQIRARTVLRYLSAFVKPADEQPAEFITKMSKPRPYQRWCKELRNVTKEVFWIFLHQLNTVPVTEADELSHNEPYVVKHFPKERPPVPAAPYVGGVEWEATNYLALHLDLMNGLIASLPTLSERNKLREELRFSGFERIMGGTLRLCKEKFYGAVHAGLRTWVDAAVEDGWDTIDVRQGPPPSPQKSAPPSPNKKDAPPRLDFALPFADPKKEVAKGPVVGGWAL
ncbi:MAG: hypothetical protein Q9159_000502 [Coniocarpon cinnabarinum]